MQQKSLTAEIMSKNKKNYLKQQPALFSQISYQDIRQINYLSDLEEKKKTIDFPIFEFQKQLEEEGPNNGLEAIASTMYRKIMQNGYIQQKKVPSKKKKKTKNPFQYDYEDEFINDDELMAPKKNLEFKFENFRSLNYNIEEFYNSQQYKANLIQIQELNKKKQIQYQPSTLQAIKKQIRQNILNKRGLIISNQNQSNLIKIDNNNTTNNENINTLNNNVNNPKQLSQAAQLKHNQVVDQQKIYNINDPKPQMIQQNIHKTQQIQQKAIQSESVSQQKYSNEMNEIVVNDNLIVQQHHIQSTKKIKKTKQVKKQPKTKTIKQKILGQVQTLKQNKQKQQIQQQQQIQQTRIIDVNLEKLNNINSQMKQQDMKV